MNTKGDNVTTEKWFSYIEKIFLIKKIFSIRFLYSVVTVVTIHKKGEKVQKEIDCAMGVYPFDRRNKEKLLGCEFIEQTDCDQLNAKVFVFQDKYRKLNIDLFFMSNGELLIGDYYGATMKREEMFHVILRGKRP